MNEGKSGPLHASPRTMETTPGSVASLDILAFSPIKNPRCSSAPLGHSLPSFGTRYDLIELFIATRLSFVKKIYLSILSICFFLIENSEKSFVSRPRTCSRLCSKVRSRMQCSSNFLEFLDFRIQSLLFVPKLAIMFLEDDSAKQWNVGLFVFPES